MAGIADYARELIAAGASPASTRRADGSYKQRGFLGEIRMPNGQDVMTELSVGVDGVGEMPAIVPGMHPADLNYLRQTGEPPRDLIMAAIRHAQKRLAGGKSPFRQHDE